MTTYKHLVIAPHPDDEAVGCGGAIIKAQERNDICKIIVICSKDINGNVNTEREKETREAMGSIGINNVLFFRECERSLLYNLEIVKKIVNQIVTFKPNFVYYPHSMEEDRDHRITNEIMNEVNLICKLEGIQYQILQYEIWTPLTKYSRSINISSIINKKRQLLIHYKSQLDSFNNFHGILGLNEYRGMQLGVTASEVYR